MVHAVSTADVAARIYTALDRHGFDDSHDPKLQPAMIAVAEKWLAHWRTLLIESPMSAVGPLASLLADAVHEAQK